MAFTYENVDCPTCGNEIVCECDDVIAFGMVERAGPRVFAFTDETALVMWTANEARIRVHDQRRVTAICTNRHFWSTVKTYVCKADDPAVEPKWIGRGAGDAERALHQSSRTRRGVLDDMDKFTVAALDWDGNLLLGWVEAEDGDAALAVVSSHESPMEFLSIEPGLIDEAELRSRHAIGHSRPLREYTVTGEAEDGRPIYEWVESFDALSAMYQVTTKFGKFEPEVVVPGHHKPLELPSACEQLGEDMKGLWASSVVGKPLN